MRPLFVILLLLVVIVNGLIITSPPGLAGYYVSTPGGIAGPPAPGFVAKLTLASPPDCCSPIQNITGVAICYRGICAYLNKYQAAYAAGASAVIIVNSNNRMVEMQRDVRFSSLAPIPGTLVKKYDGDLLTAAVQNGTQVFAQIMQASINPAQKAALVELATANKFTWKTELTLANVDTSTADPCMSPWTITNAAVGSMLCDEYGNITYITLASAGLTTIPNSLSSFTAAHTIVITGNSALTVYPTNVFSYWTRVYDIALSGNGFTGSLPDVSNWKNCKYLDLSSNQFSGSLSASIGELNLSSLILATNHLSGTIPTEISAMPRLVTLDLSYNKFEGAINDFASKVLATVDFSGNKFSGTAPTFAASTGITSLVLQDNAFEGFFQLGNLTALQVLKISKNKFTDMGSLAAFSNLQTLDISYNQFSDPEILKSKIPVNLLLLFASHNLFTTVPPMLDMLELQTIDMSHNKIEQDWRDIIVNSIPTPDAIHLIQLKGLAILLLSNNKIYQAASSGQLRVCTYAPLIKSMDLSYNNLNTSFEDAFPTTCTFFTQMDFSNNKITGRIPITLQRVISLETVDFRNNSMHFDPTLDDLFAFNYKELTLNITGSYSCPQVSINSTGTVLLVDPSYFDFTMCTCQPGYRHLPFNTSGDPLEPCRACPAHISCPGIFEDNVTIVDTGFFPIPSLADPQMAIPCLAAQQCNPKSSQQFQCAVGSSDRLCSLCEDGFYKNGNLCEHCSPTGMLLVAGAVVIFSGIVLVKLFIDIRTYMSSKHAHRNLASPVLKTNTLVSRPLTASTDTSSTTSTSSASPLSSNLILSSSSPGIKVERPWYHTRSTVSIAINYYQTLTIITKHSTLPSLVSSILEVAKLSNISKGGVGLECVGSFFRPLTATYAVTVLQPLLVVLGVSALYLVGKGVIHILKQLDQQKLAAEYWFIICAHIALFLLNFLFMPLSTYILSIFPCEKDPLTHLSYLSIEPHLPCYVIPVAGKVLPLIFDMIALYVLFCGLLVWFVRSKGDTRFILLHSFGFFFAHFKPQWVWMSILILTRRLLHAIAMGFTASDTSFLPAVNLIIIATSLVITTTAKPYKQKLDNISENVSMILLGVVYIIAFLMSNYNGQNLQAVFYLINFGITIWFLVLIVFAYQEYWRRFLPQSKVHDKNRPRTAHRVTHVISSSDTSFDENL